MHIDNIRVYYCKDIKISMEFAKECIKQLDSLHIVNKSGYVDDSGKEWTLSKHIMYNNIIKIHITCRKIYDIMYKKFITKQAYIYPIYLNIYEDSEEYHVINLDEWRVFVSTRIL